MMKMMIDYVKQKSVTSLILSLSLSLFLSLSIFLYLSLFLTL